MLLRGLSNKARADIKRTNSGETPLPAVRDLPAPSTNGRSRSRPAPTTGTARFEPADPTQVEGLLPDNFITGIVQVQDNMPDPRRYNANYTHLSALLKDPCARQIRFWDNDQTRPIFDYVGGAMRVVWRQGRATESHIREQFLKGVQNKGVIGEWSCKCGAAKREGMFDETWMECGRCRTLPNNYGELTLYDHAAGIVGNPDFLFALMENKTHVSEIKSMNDEQFSGLTEPVPDHVYQACGYRRMLEISGRPVTDGVTIMYANKKYTWGQSPYKEFQVDARQQSIQNVLDGMWDAARVIKQARADNIIPTHKVCSSPTCTQAKKCPFVTDCFNRS